MAEHNGSCWEEEAIEEYALGKMSVSGAAAFEEHLLICPRCQDRLAELDAFIQALRTVGPRLRAEDRKKKVAGARIRQWIETLRRWGERSPRVPALAGVLLVVVLIAAVPWGFRRGDSRSPLNPSVVELEAYRGAAGLVASARSDRPLTIRIRAESLPSSSSFLLEIASLTGEREWAQTVGARGGWIEATTPAPLAPGPYFVRVYLPGGALAREFSLRVGKAR
jgi:anti-sigma factor RsiW